MNGGANPHCIGVAVPHPSYDVAISIASTTHIDSQKERVASKVLDVIHDSIKKQYYPFLFNHEREKQPIGSIVSSKLFKFPDGEKGLAILIVYFTKPEASLEFIAGENNTAFEQFQKYINLDLLMEKHDEKMRNFQEVDLGLEAELSAYFLSHKAGDSGQIEVRKYNIAQIGDFKIVIYPKDHKPAHFHVVSEQRNINAKFTIEPVELIGIKKGNLRKGDEKLIKRFFQLNPERLAYLKCEAIRLEIES